MADNSNGGQYQVNDPIMPQDQSQTQIPSNDPSQQPGGIAPTPNGQMPGPDTTQPNVSTGITQQAVNPAPAGSTTTPTAVPTRLDRVMDSVRKIGDVMGGGDSVITKIDPTTGETTRVRQSVNPRAWGIALALEALSGAASGLGAGQGPGGLGRAAAAGLQQGTKIGQQFDQRQQQLDQQAQTDLQTKQQVVRNLMMTRQLALTLGRQSMDEAQDSVKADSPAWEHAQQNPADIYAKDLSHDTAYATLSKLGLGNAQVVITGVKPRTDEKGNLVYQLPNGQIVDKSTPGAYQAPDFTYAIIKPESKRTITDPDGKLDADHQAASDWGFGGVISPQQGSRLPANFQIPASTDDAMMRGYQIAQAAQKDINKSRASLGQQPIDIKNDVKNDSTVRNAMLFYNSQLNAGASHQQALEALSKSQYSAATGTIANWYGGTDGVRSLDRARAQQDLETDLKNGWRTINNRDDAEAALGSRDPQVRAMGQKRLNEIDAENVRVEREKANAAEAAHVWGQEQIDRNKQQLQLQGGNADTLSLPAQRNSDGVMVHQEYFDSLPPATQGQIKAIAYGRDEGPNTRTKDGQALDKMVNAAFPEYNKAKYPVYQKALGQATVGPTADGIKALNTAIDHAAEVFDNISATSTLPGVSSLARGFGSDQANAYHNGLHAFTEEVAKAVKGGVITQKEGEDWTAGLDGSNPASARSKIRSVLPLVKARIDEQQRLLDTASPIGVAGLRVMSSQAAQNYARLTANSSAQSQGQPATQNTPQNNVVPAGMIPGYVNGRLAGYKDPKTGQVTRF